MRDALRQAQGLHFVSTGMEDGGCVMRDSGCGLRDVGCEMRDTRCGLWDARCGMRDAGCEMRGYGYLLGNPRPEPRREPCRNLKLLRLDCHGLLCGRPRPARREKVGGEPRQMKK